VLLRVEVMVKMLMLHDEEQPNIHSTHRTTARETDGGSQLIVDFSFSC